jgi:amino acid transporter
MPRPRLFAYTMYTFYLVFVYNTSTNCMEFAYQVLTCTSGDAVDPTPDSQALRFIAIVALSFFCLMHYFSGRVGRDLNQVFAFIKITLLVILFLAGCVRAGFHFAPDWKRNPNQDASSSAIAFLSVLFSFSGWENATYVCAASLV